ncbi:hypothetical protein AMS68_000356 [Peltaster fructicola]|uniref:Transcription initiation factor TFIID subunit 8 n=1 Tax=Peltaster fructicola TaxID=286661 RepID=A0A6H0XJM4_9PEZI|nr:hypothetical protein AMS68_000356 [Peltaster fructicola]
MKRSHEGTDDSRPYKKRVVGHVQAQPAHTEPAPQQPEFTGVQLMRSISAACALAGFDSVRSTALEMFRAQAEEYMLRFATEVRISMQGQRRTQPTAQDFSMALSRTENTRAPRVLRPQLDIELPENISYPTIPLPEPAPEPVPDFSRLLKPLIESRPPRWIPSHFPLLPAQHTWKATEVWPTREKDSRKMREKATEEGMLAEQALRKLAAAAKAGAVKAEARRRNDLALSGPGKQRTVGTVRPKNEDIFGDLLHDIGGLDGAVDHEAVSARQEKVEALEIREGLLVNSSASYWRGGKRQGLAF